MDNFASSLLNGIEIMRQREADLKKREVSVQRKEAALQKRKADLQERKRDLQKREKDVKEKEVDVQTREHTLQKEEGDVRHKKAIQQTGFENLKADLRKQVSKLATAKKKWDESADIRSVFNRFSSEWETKKRKRGPDDIGGAGGGEPSGTH
ncbi:hypothetical protein HDV00_006341 [Rhizophlyctis rosea]|nr:hypothetical protein HDV00_006341 [Rhizophlyctis rosea]